VKVVGVTAEAAAAQLGLEVLPRAGSGIRLRSLDEL
jgi:hypothetical protein